MGLGRGLFKKIKKKPLKNLRLTDPVFQAVRSKRVQEEGARSGFTKEIEKRRLEKRRVKEENIALDVAAKDKEEARKRSTGFGQLATRVTRKRRRRDTFRTSPLGLIGYSGSGGKTLLGL